MKVHELITLLQTCPPNCEVEIAAGPMVAEPILQVEIPKDPEDFCFLFGGEDPEIMDDECVIIGRLSSLLGCPHEIP